MSFKDPAFWGAMCLFLLVLYTWGRSSGARANLFIVGGVLYALTWSLETPFVLAALGGITLAFDRLLVSRTKGRRLVLAVGIVAVVLPVCFFKYIAPLAPALGMGEALVPPIDAPIGLSYLTFSCISQLVESATSVKPKKRSARNFFAALLFAPKLVSGPITRPHQIEPQLSRPLQVHLPMLRLAVLMIGVGLVKVQIGSILEPAISSAFGGAEIDPALESPVGDLLFWPGMPTTLTTLHAWIAAVGFLVQLYASFSGATDIALGLGLLVGVELPPNFRLPFLSRSPIDFWSRWHISLSTWLRDHLFLPLATRGGIAAAAGAILVTMVIGGLWHGPSWTFVVWGIFQAAAIMATYVLGRVTNNRWPNAARHRGVLAAQIVATFVVQVIAGTLFAAEDMQTAGTMLRAMAGFAPAPSVFGYPDALSIVGVLLALVIPHLLDAWIARIRVTPVRTRVYALAATAIFVFLLSLGWEPGGVNLYARF